MILIRVDIGGEYGLGHGTRMVAVAKELSKLGSDVQFITRQARTQQWVRQQGFASACDVVSDEHSFLLSQMAQHDHATLVLDRKDYYEAWQFKELRQKGAVIRIDHPNAEPDTADLLIIPNMHQPAMVVERLANDFGEHLLIGADYTILGFSVVRWAVERELSLVFFAGGSDPRHILSDMYSATRDFDLPGAQKVFAVGSLASKLSLDPPVPDTIITGFHPALLRKAALAVGPLGTTVYEAMHFGTPVLMFPGIPSDGDCVEALEQATDGAVMALSTSPKIQREELCQGIRELWHDRERLAWIGHQTRKMIDGQGARRAAEAIAGLA